MIFWHKIYEEGVVPKENTVNGDNKSVVIYQSSDAEATRLYEGQSVTKKNIMNISNQYPKKGSFVNLFRLQYDCLGDKKLTQLFPGWEENGKLVPGFYAATTGRHILEPADMVPLASEYTIVLIDKSRK